MASFSGWLRTNSEHYLLIAAHHKLAREQGAPAPRAPKGVKEIFWLKVFAPTYAALPWPLRNRVMRAMPGSHRRTWSPPPRPQGPAAYLTAPPVRVQQDTASNETPRPTQKENTVAQITGERANTGDTIVDYEAKIFDDIKANEGEKAYIFMHTVPFEGSVGFVNMLTATRILRKGFDTSIVLYGPGVLMASATRGFPTVGAEAFPGHMNFNNQLGTFLKEGGKIYACRFAMAALYGMRETDLIEGVQPMGALDVLDASLTARRENAFVIQTWTV